VDTEQHPDAVLGARVGIEVKTAGDCRARFYGYGQHPAVPNPGGLLLVARIGDTELAVLLRGQQMHQLATAATKAAEEYAEEREWLEAPVTRLVSEGAA
jgi:hypothetical protein